MLFMNEYDIDEAKLRFRNHPVLSRATRFLDQFRDEVNQHSDGWAYWAPPVNACKQLMELIQKGDANEADLKKAMTPIRGFMTRRGTAAGIKLPSID